MSAHTSASSVRPTPTRPSSRHSGGDSSEEAAVLVVGLGEVGGPLLELLRGPLGAKGRDVEAAAFHGVQILHICFPFSSEFVSLVCGYVKLYEPDVVVVNSTVSPGTTRAIQETSGVAAVYSPVRGKHTRMKDELTRYRKFVAGTSNEAVARVESHFAAAGMTTQRISTFETLELAKLLETSYLGVLIAWAQEMDRFASAAGASYEEASTFFDEIAFLPPVHFQPGFIGGHCVMPNLELLERVRSSPIVDAIRASNASRAQEWARLGKSTDERFAPLERNR
ncbi:MAG TPA: hypothetical protein VEM41_00215 [Actinomycetota bacterium]|nr:hypothetical protein [Actinomycetota bacterium]